MPAVRLCRLTQATAGGALVASTLAMGLFGLPQPGALAGGALAVLAIALLVGALGLLRQLAAERAVRLPEHEAALARAVISGMVFLAVVYHLSGLVGTFTIIHVALDRLMPVWADHLLGLAPGLAIIAAAEAIRRRRHPEHSKGGHYGKL